MEKTVVFIGGVVLGAVLSGAFGLDFFPTGATEAQVLKARGELHELRREKVAYREALLQREADLTAVRAELQETRDRSSEFQAVASERRSVELDEASRRLDETYRRVESQTAELTAQSLALEDADLALTSLRKTNERQEATLALLRDEWHDALLRFLRRQDGPGDAMLVAEYLSSAQEEARKREVLLYLRQNRPDTLLGLSAEAAPAVPLAASQGTVGTRHAVGK